LEEKGNATGLIKRGLLFEIYIKHTAFWREPSLSGDIAKLSAS